jgi:hypothetical protein
MAVKLFHPNTCNYSVKCFFILSPQGEMCITGGSLPTKGRQPWVKALRRAIASALADNEFYTMLDVSIA